MIRKGDFADAALCLGRLSPGQRRWHSGVLAQLRVSDSVVGTGGSEVLHEDGNACVL